MAAVTINIGIDAKGRTAVADALSAFLADTYALYVKTQGFHWNVAGPNFAPLHEQFGLQYQEFQKAIDVVAERIRALGHSAPGSLTLFSRLSRIKDEAAVPKATAMIRQLVNDNEALSRAARAVFDIAEKAKDDATADLMIERIDIHDKNAWMLRVQLE